jgi:beta-N-acetylhexosaminidase
MPDNKLLAFNALKKAVEDGVITEERINESVLRILSLKYKYGIITE